MEKIINFLNYYFEEIIAINVYWLIGIIVIAIALKVRYIRGRHIQEALRSVFLYGATGISICLFLMTVGLFVYNLATKPPLDFSSRVQGTTQWVQEDITIYFIADKTLVCIQTNGQKRSDIFQAPDTVREYHFSPDGRHILIVTEKELYLYNRYAQTSDRVASFNLEASPEDIREQGIKTVIDGIQWSPNSMKYCYRMAKWSKVSSSRDQWVVADISTNDKKMIRNRFLKINSLEWDETGENLYFSWFKTIESAVYASPLEVKVYKVPLATLQPELVLNFPFNRHTLPEENMALRGINLFSPERPLSFGRSDSKHDAKVSTTGSKIGIDDDDHLYYVRKQWWQRRLYQIPRIDGKGDTFFDPERLGQLVVQHLRWLPASRYVIMEHYFFGVLILEPASGKIGILVNDRGKAFGWFEGPMVKREGS